jgi:hypothetical protein
VIDKGNFPSNEFVGLYIHGIPIFIEEYLEFLKITKYLVVSFLVASPQHIGAIQYHHQVMTQEYPA